MTALPDFSLLKVSEVREYIRDNFFDCLKVRHELLNKCALDKRKGVQELGPYFLEKEATHISECERVRSLYEFDRSYGSLVAGVDEVGRGPLAGPIVGAAVILKNDCATEELILGINDSKLLSRKKRAELVPVIKERALAWAIFEHSNDDIDELGIAFCNNNIFIRSVQKLTVTPEVVLSDGYPIKGYRGKNATVVRGDAKSAAIACASIIAKVHRDELMRELDRTYPGYGFSGNVGYGCSEHIRAIQEIGPCRVHRRSFLTRILEGYEESVHR